MPGLALKRNPSLSCQKREKKKNSPASSQQTGTVRPQEIWPAFPRCATTRFVNQNNSFDGELRIRLLRELDQVRARKHPQP